ncbi:hypothetical protein MRB53_035258 [Persea americana]|uniref:Uncharacterized protein n=1 Tax=Persea americana TaxID=3435 RepID=A0ACC2K465_PERAE|nr:hypothetical protein MRB53_035258 [Persea americana]
MSEAAEDDEGVKLEMRKSLDFWHWMMLLKVQRVWVSSFVQTQRGNEKVEDNMFNEMPLREREGGEEKNKEGRRGSMNPNR